MPSEKKPGSAVMVVVSLRWNGEPLVTRSARGGEAIALGDVKGALAPLPAEALGAPSLTIADGRGGAHVLVPEGKVASFSREGSGVRLVAGPAREALAPGEEATLLFGAFEVVIAAHANEAPKRGRRVLAGAWVHTAMVAAVHAALLFASSRAALASSMEEGSSPDVEQLRAYLASAEERSSTLETRAFDSSGSKDEKRANGRDGNGKDGGGERHAGEAGKAGSTTSRAAQGRWGATPQASGGRAMPDVDDLEAARTFGMIGLLGAGEAAAVRSMEGPSPWGSNDPFAAMGGMLGHLTGASEGAGGLALTGTGEGGGGRGEGIGLGTIGTIGHTDGRDGFGTGGAGNKLLGIGFGSAWGGGWGRDRIARAAVVRWGHWGHGVVGRLPAETIQRIVRANFGRFRACYENGLRGNPGLVGRVSVRFVIGRDGAVSSVADGGSDIPDAAVTSCVVRAFYGLSFPQPEGGIVSVTYPISFTTITDHR